MYKPVQHVDVRLTDRNVATKGPLCGQCCLAQDCCDPRSCAAKQGWCFLFPFRVYRSVPLWVCCVAEPFLFRENMFFLQPFSGPCHRH